ncbi:MAG TPA: alpha/beta fold hydrolase [Burkholderiales bacterium]|nr:alpha/beta fold hydrolase [Burkholderiales bacterium]
MQHRVLMSINIPHRGGRAVRVIDTGVRGGRENVAFDQALIEARNAGKAPETVRFLRFRPCALVGLHQMLSHEVRLDYCRAHGIEVGRRITGGGALYLDEGQLCWGLALERRRLGVDLAAISARICNAAAAGLRRLGVAAQFRPRNDIEVDGRKVSGTGGLVDGETLFYQGTLLVDFDPARMIEVLKVPVDKLARRDLDDARKRVVSLRELLGEVPPMAAIEEALLAGFGEHLGLELERGAPTQYEETLAQRLYEAEYGTEAFVHLLDDPGTEPAQVSATLVRKGGTIRADLRLEGPQRDRIREALVTGDFFLSPARARLDLEARLRGVAAGEAGATVEAFFRDAGCEAPGLSAADFREAVESALAQISVRAGGHELRGHWRGPRPAQAPTLVFLHDALGSVRLWRDFPDQLVRATGCGALLYDRWGSGESEPLTPPFGADYLLEEAMQALPEVLDRVGVREAILVGQSDGASIALAHAGAFPGRIRGVIALSPHLFVEPRTLATIREQIRDFEHGDLKARLRRHHGANTEPLFARLVEVWTTHERPQRPLEPHIARIRCPVLAIQGADDEFFSVAQLDALEALIPGRLERLRIPGAAHYPLHQARNEVLAAAIRFIRAATASGTRSPHAAAGG